MLARVATRYEKNPFVEVALGATRLVVEAFVMVALVVVELPTIRSAIEANVATRDAMKELVLVLLTDVRLVVEAFVKYPLVAVMPVPEAFTKLVCPDTVRLVAVVLPRVEVPDTVRRVAVVVARVDVPVTVRVPPIASLPVTVEVPIVEVLAVR